MAFDPARDANGLNAFFVPQADDRQTFGGLWYTGRADYTPIFLSEIPELIRDWA